MASPARYVHAPPPISRLYFYPARIEKSHTHLEKSAL